MTDAIIILDPPCPFCGNNTGKIAVIEIIEFPGKPSVFDSHVRCLGCHAQGPSSVAPTRVFAAAQAYSYWQKRVVPTPGPSSS